MQQAPKAAAPRHFSMVRGFHLADFFTLANAACGVATVFLAMIYVGNASVAYFLAAAAMAPVALVFDVLDGRIARWRHTHSALGRELDSLADVISFGVAPAALAFAAGMRGGWDVVILIYFVCCGVSRLARYNVTAESLSGGGDKVAYFEGTRIGRDTIQVFIGQQALRQWRKRNTAYTLFFQHIKQTIFNPTLKHRVFRLMNNDWRTHFF